MIYIKHSKIQIEHRLAVLLRKFPLEITLDLDAVDEDISRMLDIDTRSRSSNYVKNWENTLDYLERIKKHYNRFCDKRTNSLRIQYLMADNKLRTTPLELVRIPLFNIETANYINLCGGTLIDVDFSNLARAIGFTYVFNDLDHTIEENEDKLKDVSSISTQDGSLLDNIIDEDVTYKEMKYFKIGECPYCSPDKTKIYSYFNDELDNDTGKYDKVLEYSCKKAMMIVLENLFNKLDAYKYRVGIAGLYDDDFKILCHDNKCVNEILSVLSEGVSINIFGRNFRYVPKISTVNSRVENKEMEV